MRELNQNEKKLMNDLSKHIGKIPYDLLERFILNTPSVYRPIVGHCFETWFENLLSVIGINVKRIGGII